METERTMNGEAQAVSHQTHQMTWMSSFTHRSGDEFHCIHPQWPNTESEKEPPPQELVHFWSPDRRPGIYFQFICERITSFQIIRHQQAGGSSSDQAERDAPRHVLPSHRTLWRSTGAAGLLAWFINFSPSVRRISPRLWCLRIQSTTTTTSVTSEPQNRRAATISFECACVCVRVCICTAALMRSSMINTWKTNIPPTSSHEGFYSILEGYIDPPIFSRESVDLRDVDHMSYYQNDGHNYVYCCTCVRLEGRHWSVFYFHVTDAGPPLGAKSGSTNEKMNENRTENEPLSFLLLQSVFLPLDVT